MTEPRVEAVDRALETARKILANVDTVVHIVGGEPKFIDSPTFVEECAALIQSAMNAQERELLLLAGRLLESQSPEWGDVDGASIEEWLIEAGLLKQVDVTEECYPLANCVCAEFGFPSKCNRRTEL